MSDKSISISDFCPTLQKEYSITVDYSNVRQNQYMQVGANCNHALENGCPVMLQCPLRAKAPINKIF